MQTYKVTQQQIGLIANLLQELPIRCLNQAQAIDKIISSFEPIEEDAPDNEGEEK